MNRLFDSLIVCRAVIALDSRMADIAANVPLSHDWADLVDLAREVVGQSVPATEWNVYAAAKGGAE